MNRPPIIRTVLIVALVGAISLIASACGSSSSGSSSSGGGSTAAGAPAGGGSGTSIDVSLKDFSINVASSGTLTPGTYTFHVTNQGPSAHNLTVNGPGVNQQGTSTFASGGSEDLTVTLQAGTYELYCSVPGHKQAGMDTSITVGG